MSNFNCHRIIILILLMTVGWQASLVAQFQQPQQEEKELSPVSRTYAITNVNIIQAPGRKIDKGTVVIKNGLIHSVGKNIAVPPEAIVMKGDSLYVYAGFIDGLSHTGITKPKEEPNKERPKDPGNPLPEAAGITPQNDVRSSLNATEKTIDELRAQGFTVAQVVPYGGMLPGNASIILLNGKTADEMMLSSKSALYAELTGAQRVYPNTIIAVMAKWRELYRQASQAKSYEAMYASNRAGLNRPASDRILEAFYPVIDKRQPVLFESDKYLKTQRVLALQSDLGFSLIVADVKEGWDAIPKLKASNAKVFLSLDLPEEKKDDKKDVKKDSTKTDSVKTVTPKVSDPEMLALEKRKADAIALYVSQASAFQKAGIPFGFSALTVKVSDIRPNLKRMITAGLTEDQALAALTTSPAQLLGLSDRLGTIDQGKIANLVLSDKPYFHEKAKVRYVFVDGVLYKYDSKETPKSESAVVINITGTWSVTTETNQGKHDEKLTIKKDGNSYSGSLSGGRFTEAVSLEDVSLNGNKLKYSYTTQAEGQSMKVDVEVTIEGDSFKGTATAGRFGTFPVEGKKDPNR
jgi:imidazolonepropionase-like amidohydrolase